jgi:hypothetical protein
MSGFGVVIGVPAMELGATLAGHGTATSLNAIDNLNKVHHANSSGSGGTFSADSSLPTLDGTGKVHGPLPDRVNLYKYSKDALKQLLKELKISVQTRIKMNGKLGVDKAGGDTHGLRQAQEQTLIRDIENYLKSN